MSSIGTIPVAVDILRERMAVLKQEVDVWRVLGLDGYGAMVLGLGSAESRITVIAYAATNADADDLIDSLEQMQGTVQSITDDFGDTLDNALIVHVHSDGPQVKQACIKDGSASVVRVQIPIDIVHAFE